MLASLLLILSVTVSQNEPAKEPGPPAIKRSVDLTSTAEPPRLRLEDVAAVFASHYDTTTFPMLSRDKVRRSLEEPAYRVYYWTFTGRPARRPLMTAYEIVSYVLATSSREGVVGSEESHRISFENRKVIGIAFPDTPIRFLTVRPIDFLGEWTTDPAYQFAGDPYSDYVFAVARCIAEVENENYREITVTYMYSPGRETFVPVSERIETIHDPLTMLMRLHGVEDHR